MVGERGGGFQEIRAHLSLHGFREGFAQGEILIHGLENGVGFQAWQAHGAVSREFPQGGQAVTPGGSGLVHSREPAQPGGIPGHGVRKAQVTVDLDQGDLLGARRIAGGFSEIMVPQPDAEDECQQGDERFGIFPPQDRAIGIPAGKSGMTLPG